MILPLVIKNVKEKLSLIKVTRIIELNYKINWQ